MKVNQMIKTAFPLLACCHANFSQATSTLDQVAFLWLGNQLDLQCSELIVCR